MPAYSIVTERPIDGYDQFVHGEAVALASDLLDRLAADAGVRPLLNFFSMDPGEVDALFDGLNLELPEGAEGVEMEANGTADPADTSPLLEETPPEEWFEPTEGLATVRALIRGFEARPVPAEPDPFDPPADAVLADLRQFETVLNHLDAEGVRWHLSVDF